jgi:hypothetical protein
MQISKIQFSTAHAPHGLSPSEVAFTMAIIRQCAETDQNPLPASSCKYAVHEGSRRILMFNHSKGVNGHLEKLIIFSNESHISEFVCNSNVPSNKFYIARFTCKPVTLRLSRHMLQSDTNSPSVCFQLLHFCQLHDSTTYVL